MKRTGENAAGLDSPGPEWSLLLEGGRDPSDAQQSMQHLINGGMGPYRILWALYRYTAPGTRAKQKELHQTARDVVAILTPLRLRLHKASHRLDQDDEARATAPISWPWADLQDVSDRLLHDSVLVAELIDLLKPLRSAKGKLRNEEILVALCMEIRVVTGKPHWTDIGYLVEAAWAIRGVRQRPWNEDRLRKLFNRYEATHPAAFQVLKGKMKASTVATPTGAPTSRSTKNRRILKVKSVVPGAYIVHGKLPSR